MSKSERMYKNSPKMERDSSTGKVAVKKQPKDEGAKDDKGTATKADEQDMGLDAEGSKPGENEHMPVQMHHAHERTQMHHRHVQETLNMHRRHELEHNMAGEGDKKLLHKKHEAEHKSMHEQHHEELKTMHKRHDKSAKSSSENGGGKEISKIESDKKED